MPNYYPEQKFELSSLLLWGMGGKFKFSAQDKDLKYLFLRSKNLPVPSDIIPPL